MRGRHRNIGSRRFIQGLVFIRILGSLLPEEKVMEEVGGGDMVGRGNEVKKGAEAREVGEE